MATTTHPELNENTEALEVAAAFDSGIRGKTVLVTGVNRGGIGFSTAHAFVGSPWKAECLVRLTDCSGLPIAVPSDYHRSRPGQTPGVHQCSSD